MAELTSERLDIWERDIRESERDGVLHMAWPTADMLSLIAAARENAELRAANRELDDARRAFAEEEDAHSDVLQILAHVRRERDEARAEADRLRRGEYICHRCGLRKDSDDVLHDEDSPF